MIELEGKYNRAKIFCEELEETARQQIITFLNHPAFAGGDIRIMPDVHAGAGAVIGFTSPMGEKVIPNVIGVDIGCGVTAWNTGAREIDFAKLDRFIRQNIPSGRDVRKSEYSELENIYKSMQTETVFGGFSSHVEKICAEQKQDSARVMRSIGSLGGGNHFIEIDEAGKTKWLVVHSGSRNFGLKIALHHQHLALNKVGDMKGLEYLEGSAADAYKSDMKTAQIYAALNRAVMGNLILTEFFGFQNVSGIEKIESVHNYINFKDGIIRKGAISAHKDEEIIIPFNMLDGCILGRGKGNPDWNYSAPHGAGRRMSRTAAKKNLNLNEFKAAMKGIWTSSVSARTIDEAPQVYKDTADVIELLEPSVEIQEKLTPVYNFKAAE